MNFKKQNSELIVKTIPGITTTMVNTLRQLDHANIEFGKSVAHSSIYGTLLPKGAKIVIACDQRWWEYGSAIQLLLNHYGKDNILPSDLEILDVGSGWSGLGPAINLTWNCNVTEYEPVEQYCNDRIITNNVLRGLGFKGTDCQKIDMVDMPEKQFDAVFCISVLEHVAKDIEKQCWKNLASRVKPGGLMFITCDVVDDPKKPHIYDEMRVMPNYTLDDMKERVEMLVKECDMATIGIPDYTYNGHTVQDFTFFRAAFYKEKVWTRSVH